MFRVPTLLAPSPIHGIGVYTTLPIPAGTVIWDFTPGVDWQLTAQELEQLPERYRDRFRAWCDLEESSGLYVLCGDNARFMNHSPEPNCDDRGERTVAARDIEADEELTCDYRTFDAESRALGVDSHLTIRARTVQEDQPAARPRVPRMSSRRRVG